MSSQILIKRYVFGAGASFLLMTAVCFLLHPEIVQNYTYGISYFGSVPETMFPYYIGFLATILCLAGIAWQLLRFWPRILPLVVAFWAAALFMTGIAATSYATNDTVFLIHLLFSFGLTLNELVIAWWIIRRPDVQPLDLLLTVVLAITIMVSALPLVHDIPFFRSFPLRELIVFVSALALTGRAAIRVSAPKGA